VARLILAVLLAAAALVLTWQLALLPGTVAVDIGELSVEAPVPVAALGLLALFASLYLLLRGLGVLHRAPRTLRARKAARHRAQGDQAVTRALVALAAGDANAARREAAGARRLLGDTPQTLLLASEAGRLAGRMDETEGPLLALAARKDAAFLGLRGLLRDAMARQDWEAAADLARKAEAAHPGAAWLRTERAQLAVRNAAWGEALALTGDAGMKAALAAGAAGTESNSSRALDLARQAFEADPALAPAALAYATRLRAAGRERRVEAVLRQAWGRAPQQALAEFYLAPLDGALSRVQAAKRLVETNPVHAESHFLLARVSLAAGLTGEARHQVQEAHKAGMNERRLWSLLADIEEQDRGGSEEGRAAQRDALRKVAEATADAGWSCSACGTAHAAWRPACAGCGTAGALRWGVAGAAHLAPAREAARLS